MTLSWDLGRKSGIWDWRHWIWGLICIIQRGKCILVGQIGWLLGLMDYSKAPCGWKFGWKCGFRVYISHLTDVRAYDFEHAYELQKQPSDARIVPKLKEKNCWLKCFTNNWEWYPNEVAMHAPFLTNYPVPIKMMFIALAYTTNDCPDNFQFLVLSHLLSESRRGFVSRYAERSVHQYVCR